MSVQAQEDEEIEPGQNDQSHLGPVERARRIVGRPDGEHGRTRHCRDDKAAKRQSAQQFDESLFRQVFDAAEQTHIHQDDACQQGADRRDVCGIDQRIGEERYLDGPDQGKLLQIG
jgi:hypothetical protein